MEVRARRCTQKYISVSKRNLSRVVTAAFTWISDLPDIAFETPPTQNFLRSLRSRLKPQPKFSSLAALAKHLICQNYLIDLQVADRGLIHTLLATRARTERVGHRSYALGRRS